MEKVISDIGILSEKEKINESVQIHRKKYRQKKKTVRRKLWVSDEFL